MRRKDFLKTIALLPLTGAAMKLNALNKFLDGETESEKMPVFFIGHGNPMNAIEDNQFSREMKNIGATLPKPKAILMVSAHWETNGTFVTANENPETIHDFGGFPQELFDVQYPAPGSKWLADETIADVHKAKVEGALNWGFDHGCWSVTKNMYPLADVPIVQLSLDYTKDPQYHYGLAKELAVLRTKGVLIIGSGNMVHNLGRIVIKDGSLNTPYALDWAQEASEKFKKCILEGDHQSLINYKNMGSAAKLAVPTPEHFLPLLYSLALKEEKDSISLFSDVALAGSLTMTSVKIG